MQKLVLSRGTNITPKVKRFMEDMAGGRNPYDSFAIIDNEDNVRVIGDERSWKFGAIDTYGPNIIKILPNGEKASKVYVTGVNMFILSTLGNVYVSGQNNYGQCGLPAGSGVADVTTSTRIDSGITNCIKVSQPTNYASRDPLTTMFLTAAGRLYSAGYNQYGQVGDGTVVSTGDTGPRLTLGPGNPYGNPTTTVIDVLGVGGNDTANHPTTFCALLSNGTVWCVGYGGRGQMGNGTTTAANSLWQQVQDAATSTALTNIVSIYGSGLNSFTALYALNASGELFSWGYNGEGQLGIGSTVNATRATKVTSLGTNVAAVYAFTTNDGSIIVKTKDGNFYGAGNNSGGQLGLGNTTQQNSFTLITSLQNKNIDRLYCRGDNTPMCVWAKELGTNRIYACGTNTDGNLGLYNLTTPVTTFTEVPFNVISPIIDIMPIMTDGIGSFTIILTADGNTYFTGQSRWNYVGVPNRNETIFRKNTKYIVGA